MRRTLVLAAFCALALTTSVHAEEIPIDHLSYPIPHDHKIHVELGARSYMTYPALLSCIEAEAAKGIHVDIGSSTTGDEYSLATYYLISDGGREPYRLKIRTGSFSNLSVLPYLLKGIYVPDIVAILGSLDFVVGDVDR